MRIFLTVHPLVSFKQSVIRAFICVFICMCCMLISAEIVCLRQMNELLFASMANMPIWQPCHIPWPIHNFPPSSIPDPQIPVIDMCLWYAFAVLCASDCLGHVHCSVLLRARLIKIINQSCYLALIFSTPFCLKITTIFSYHFYEDIKTKCQPKKHTVYFL